MGAISGNNVADARICAGTDDAGPLLKSHSRRVNKHHREPLLTRTNCVCLHAKFARTNMTKRLKLSWAESATPSTASSAQSTRWRLFAHIAIALSSATASKRTDKSSVVSTAHGRPAQHS